jgi:hypothetical protein
MAEMIHEEARQLRNEEDAFLGNDSSDSEEEKKDGHGQPGMAAAMPRPSAA